MKRLLFAATLWGVLASVALGQVSFSGASNITITFDSTVTGSNNGQINGLGFQPGAPSVGRWDSNSWRSSGMSDSGGSTNFGDTDTTGDYARGNSGGSVTTGGFWAFDRDSTAGTNMIMGIQPTGNDFTPGTLDFRFLNATGSSLSTISISYEIYVFNDTARSQSFDFSYSTNGTTFTDVPSLDYSTPTTAGASAWILGASRSVVLSGFSVPNGQHLILRWSSDDDGGGGGDRDQFGLDNLQIANVPEPTTIALFVGGAGLAGTYAWRRRRAAKTNAALDHAEAGPTDEELEEQGDQ